MEPEINDLKTFAPAKLIHRAVDPVSHLLHGRINGVIVADDPAVLLDFFRRRRQIFRHPVISMVAIDINEIKGTVRQCGQGGRGVTMMQLNHALSDGGLKSSAVKRGEINVENMQFGWL